MTSSGNTKDVSVPLIKWSDDEEKALCQAINEQMEATGAALRTLNWHRVSEQLQNDGYHRTPSACKSRWTKTNKKIPRAAGRPWCDAECQILVDFIKAQLKKEEEDITKLMSWSKAYDKASEELRWKGYHKSPKECETFWLERDDSSDDEEAALTTPKRPGGSSRQMRLGSKRQRLGEDSEQTPKIDSMNGNGPGSLLPTSQTRTPVHSTPVNDPDLRDRVDKGISYSKKMLPGLKKAVETRTNHLDTLKDTLQTLQSRRRRIHEDFESELARTIRVLEEKRGQELHEVENEQLDLQRVVAIENVELEKAIAELARIKKDEEEFGRFFGHLQRRMSDGF